LGMEYLNKTTILVELGNLGSNVIDHLMSPLARARNVKMVDIFCHIEGPVISNVSYHHPPKIFAKFAPISALYQWTALFYKALFSKASCVAGYLLNPHGLVAFIVAKITRKKVIISLIAGSPELYTKGSIKGIDFKKDIPPWWGKLFLFMLKRADAIITTGSVTKQFLVNHGVKSERIHPIISPANRTRFYPVQTPKLYDTIFISRISYIKHLETFLWATSIAKKKYPDIKACIVGDGSLLPEMKLLAKNLGIENNVEFLGWREDIAFLLNSAKVFVHTSEREGFPNVFLEAMLCGLACVVSNCGDIIDIAKDGKNSLVVEKYDDYHGFANAIIKLMDDNEFYKTISKNALASMTLLSDEEATDKWETVIAMALTDEK
jgi:glycosyltransferase involved in cell wall biosynthesis